MRREQNIPPLKQNTTEGEGIEVVLVALSLQLKTRKIYPNPRVCVESTNVTANKS